jgi:hypothetical protein
MIGPNLTLTKHTISYKILRLDTDQVHREEQQPTKCTEHIPSWGANSSMSQPRNWPPLWNLKAHYRVHRNPAPAPILSQINPVRIFQTSEVYFPNNYFILTPVLSSKPSSSERCLTFRLPNQNAVCIYSPWALHATPISSSLIWSL